MTNHITSSIDASGLVPIDVARLIVTRLLVEASSGGGKSWLLRRLLEVTFGDAQQIVLDYDGEFHTLREKYDYVLIGPGGDCPADVRSAGLLARRLLELGTSAVIDISDLGVNRAVYVKNFIDGMMTAPRDLWHDVLVVVDECHKLAPEKGAGEAVSTESIKDLATRGRKRGFALVAATQRVSELHKTVIAECNNKLIGRTSLDLDIDRAKSMLGMSRKDAYDCLPKLEDGHFYAFGPALCKQVTLVKVGPVLTTHPTAGQRSLPPTPPRGEVKRILAQLADLPQEAEDEARTVAQLRERVKELEGATSFAASDRAFLDELMAAFEGLLPGDTQRTVLGIAAAVRRLKETSDLSSRTILAYEHLGSVARKVVDMLKVATLEVDSHLQEGAEASPGFVERQRARGRDLYNAPPFLTSVIATSGALPGVPMIRRQGDSGVEVVRADGIKVSKMETAILTCLAQRKQSLSRKQILTFTGYRNSGTVGQAFARLIRDGWVEGWSTNGTGNLHITAAGLKVIGNFTPLPTGRELRMVLMESLSTMESAMLKNICEAYPSPVTRKHLLSVTGYKNSGTVGQAFARLITMGYINKASNGAVVAAKELFS